MDNRKLISQLSSKLGRDRNDVTKLLEGFASVLKTRCGELDSIAIPSFGSFEPKMRKERVVTVPSTGKKMLMPPKITLSFKVSAVLKNKLK